MEDTAGGAALPPLLHVHFRERVRRTPDSLALLEDARSITYRELDRLVCGLSGALRAREIGEGARVGVHMERSIPWVAALLGVLDAGAAVVPLPPRYPQSRLREIVSMGQLTAVVDAEETPFDPPPGLPCLRLDDVQDGGAADNPRWRGGQAFGNADDPAFILSSSGSTGRPKMIVRSHRSFFHRLGWTWKRHPFAAEDVGCQKAHMTTTHACYELFEPLLDGAPTVIIGDPEARDLEGLWERVRTGGITRLLIVPSALRASLDMPGFEAPELKVVVIMGEYVPSTLAERAVAAFGESTHLYSIYGSTEASSALVVNIRDSLRSGEELPLGQPISGDVEALVLDANLLPVAPGGIGRLHLSGTPLFSGYLHHPRLTSSVLIHAPGSERLIFDTRDRVRRTEDGSLLFVGRVDDTVKIRGFRVELSEVERVMESHPDVLQAAVVVEDREESAHSLIGFFIPAAVGREGVYEVLRQRLPEYMIPSELHGVDAFPLTASAKVDRGRLLRCRPDDQVGASERSPLTSLSSTELGVADVWARTLGHSRFAPDSSFFEAGGTSLTAFALVYRLREAFDLEGDRLSAEVIYRYPTLAEQAAFVETAKSGLGMESQMSSPILVTLRGGDKAVAPLFVVASAGGTLGGYERLARTLRTKRAIVGVRDPFLWGDREPTESFGQWVGRYMEAIRERQPRGPYNLCAYSSAGAFGYEIARRFREEGEEVGLLALVDPLAMDRSSRWRYGYWVLRSTWMRPSFRLLVRLGGYMRIPVVRLLHSLGLRPDRREFAFSSGEVDRIAAGSLRSPPHLANLAALLELNSGMAFSLTDDDFHGRDPDEYLDVLQARVASAAPEVDPAQLERLAVQYELQVRTQHAYRLLPYTGRVLTVEPASGHSGLVATQLRAFVPDLHARILPVSVPTQHERALTQRFGALAPHYRSMRDQAFVDGLARELEMMLG